MLCGQAKNCLNNVFGSMCRKAHALEERLVNDFDVVEELEETRKCRPNS